MARLWLGLLLLSALRGAHGGDVPGECVYPEICRPPPHKYSKVLPVRGRFQWTEAGGFCGSLSIQTLALTQGAWISQDRVRKANRGGLCFGHTDAGGGCEVGPENYGLTARSLKLDFEEWDFTQPAPQAAAFKRWLKSHLVKGEPVMWAPMVRGGQHTPYGRVSAPGSGHFDHHEPIVGFGSNHDLSDPDVYDDDWLVHYSNFDEQPCYRNFSSLEDDVDMQGNCRDVRQGHNVMYPCFFKQVTYGLALKGLSMFGARPRPQVHLEVDRRDEPQVRLGQGQAALLGTVSVKGLERGRAYVLYRFNSTEALPDGAAIDLLDVGFEHRYPFQAAGDSWAFVDPWPIMSGSATYYVAVPADVSDLQVADSLKEQTPVAFLRDSPGFASARLASRPADPGLAQGPSFQSLAGRQPGARWQIFAGASAGAAACAVAAVSLRISLLRRRAGFAMIGREALG